MDKNKEKEITLVPANMVKFCRGEVATWRRNLSFTMRYTKRSVRS